MGRAWASTGGSFDITLRPLSTSCTHWQKGALELVELTRKLLNPPPHVKQMQTPLVEHGAVSSSTLPQRPALFLFKTFTAPSLFIQMCNWFVPPASTQLPCNFSVYI